MLYMVVTSDQLELPLYVADSPKEIAKKFNTSVNNVNSAISKNLNGKRQGYKFIKVKEE